MLFVKGRVVINVVAVVAVVRRGILVRLLMGRFWKR